MSFRGKSAVDELRELVAVLDRRLQQLDARVNELQVTAGSLAQRAEDRWEDIAETQRDITEALRLLHADDPGQRRRLRAARRAESYELAFTEPEPLISVVIATYDHHQLLAERALPSVLAQTYERLEVVVIGDAAPAEAEAVVRSAGDPRVSYRNLPVRGAYPDDPVRRWFVAGDTPLNEGAADALGRWIAPMADDDVMRPDHLERLLARARRDHLEFVYGRFLSHSPDGDASELGVFPPVLGQVTWQATLLHADLRFFELELTDALFGIPSDWAAVERMRRAGVRMGMVEEVLIDLYPSLHWGARGVSVADLEAHYEKPG